MRHRQAALRLSPTSCTSICPFPECFFASRDCVRCCGSALLRRLEPEPSIMWSGSAMPSSRLAEVAGAAHGLASENHGFHRWRVEAPFRAYNAARWRSKRGIMTTTVSATVPGNGVDQQPDEYYDDEDDEYYDDEYYESSDDELDWDPDRERLLRFVRQANPAAGASSSSAKSAAGNAPASGKDASSSERQKSLAERRNEWRASRGLARQKTVQELIAEKRAARLGLPAPTAAADAAPPPPPPAPEPELAPHSDSRVDELHRQLDRMGQEPAVEVARSEDGRISSTSGSESSRKPFKRGWPWRSR